MDLEGNLFDVDYKTEKSEAVVRLYLRDEDKTYIAEDRSFKPYFYVVPRENSFKELKEELESLEFEDEKQKEVIKVVKVGEKRLKDSKDEVDVLQVYLRHPSHVPKTKSYVRDWENVEQVREFDIPFYKRYLIDKGIQPPSKVKVEGKVLEETEEVTRVELESLTQLDGDETFDFQTLAFDLEVVDDKIVMCSIYSQKTEKVLVDHKADFEKEFVEAVESEKHLLKKFKQIVREENPLVITGYNTDEYDFKVLRKRFRHHDLKLDIGKNNQEIKFQRKGRRTTAEIKGRMHLDLYPFISTIVSSAIDSETMDLDSVSQEILGKEKEDMDWSDIKDSWRNKKDLDKLAKYALKDSELAYELSKNIVPQIFSLSKLVGLTPFDVCRTSYGQLVENYMIRESYFEKRLVPSRPYQDTIKQRRGQGSFIGAFVYEPEEGIHENIGLYDFKSLYPTIIASHNLSPDTLDVENCGDELSIEIDDEEYKFCQEEKGFIPGILEELVTERYKIKKEMKKLEEDTQEYRNHYNRQNALKILSNSFYGYMGYASARWYSRESAEATTYLGRKYIHETIDIAEEMGLKVVYGDTDSVMIKGENIDKVSQKFQEKVNSQLPGLMELEKEGFFTRGFFTYTDQGRGAKKKYALLQPDGETKITGFEYVRRDWSPIAKETQKKILDKVLDKEVEEAYQITKDTIEELKKGEVPIKKLSIYTTLTKKPENYSSKAPHVEAAKKAIQRGEKVGPGDTVDFVITAHPSGGTISDRAEMTKFAKDYDPHYYIEKQIIPVAERVLKVFGYTESQMKGEGKQSGLQRFS